MNSSSASWSMNTGRLLRQAFRLDINGLAVGAALRAAVGILVLLVLGIVTGHATDGVAAAGGAVGMGTVSLSGTYRAKMHIMLPAAVALAVSAFVGMLTGPIGWLFVVVAALWGLAGGILSNLGSGGMTFGLMAGAMVIVFSHIALPPSQAALVAGALLGGALFQTALALAPWPLRRFLPERQALSSAYRGLAAYASNPSISGQATDALREAASTLRGGDTGGEEGETLRDLFVEADRIHLELIRLYDGRSGLAGGAARLVDELARAVAETLDSLAEAVDRMRVPAGVEQFARRIATALSELRKQHGEYEGGREELALRYAQASAEALRSQLDAAVRLATQLAHPDATDDVEIAAPDPHQRRQVPFDHGGVEILRANLSPRSVSFQHAVRLAIALGIGAALYKGFPIGRDYWVPFTALMVLRPDFTTTFTRGIARWAGTAVGVVLATVLVAFVPLNHVSLTALVVVIAFVSFAVFSINYALYSVFLTAMVLFLLAFTGASPDHIAVDRFIDTAIGAALGLGIFLLWPTWARTQVPGNLADMLNAERGYFDQVLEGYLDPAAYDRPAIRRHRLSVRRTIADAESSVKTLRLEPGSDRTSSDVALSVLDATRRFTRGLLALDTGLEKLRDGTSRSQLANFGESVDGALLSIENAMREGGLRPKLECTQQVTASAAALRRRDDRDADDGGVSSAFIALQADRIADSLNTICHLLTADSMQANL